MKFLIVLIMAIGFSISSVDLDVIRDAYKEASNDKTKVDALNRLLLSVTKEDEAVLVAYKGASTVLNARYSKILLDKKKMFIEGVSYIEHAIDKVPDEVELRFIRISIQENTPKFLKYKDNIEEDKQLILTQFNSINSSSLKNHIQDYILHSELFTDEEKSVISKS
jgi:hypothetical protein